MSKDDFLNLRKFVVPEFIFGTKARKLAGQYAENLSLTNILVVTDGGIEKAGWLDDLLDCLAKTRIQYTVYDKLTPNPKDYEMMAGAEVFQAANCDGMIALGGGSVIDCAKGIGIVASNGGHISDYEGFDNIFEPSAPIICIPTTAGSSADISQFAVVTDSKRLIKYGVISKSLIPDVSLIDPEVTLTKDKQLTISSAIDALVHAIEAVASNAGSPITELHALEAIRLINLNLYETINKLKNIELRTNMMLASLHSGMAFSNAGLGLVHALAHSVGGLKDLTHGRCNAIFLPQVIDFNFESAQQQYLKIARAMGVNTTNLTGNALKDKLLERVTTLLKSIGVSECLSDLGIKKEDLSTLAASAMQDGCLLTNPREVTVQDIEALYEKSL